MNDGRATLDGQVPRNPCTGPTFTAASSTSSPHTRDYITQPRVLWQRKAVSLQVVSFSLLNKFSEN